MFQQRTVSVLAFLAAVLAVASLGGPLPAKATPNGPALLPNQPTTRHVALLKGSGGELSFPVLELAHSIISPRDSASGLPTGKRQHKPFTITKSVDEASPALFMALLEGEPFTTVEITTLRRVGGRFVPFTTVRLETAFVGALNSGSGADRPTEEVAFYYNKIGWSYAETGTTVEDFWAGEYP